MAVERAPASDAREVAATVLMRVVDQGAFAMRALDAELGRAQLSARDAALATEIVYGALRVLPRLDAHLAPFTKRGLAETDPLTLAALRVGAYQLLHLGRVPPHAAVDSAVGLIRRVRSRQSAGFVNAVLRRVAKARPERPTPPTEIAAPAWLSEVLRDSLGPERAQAMLTHDGGAPPLGLAVATEGERQALCETLSAAAPRGSVSPGALSPHALILRRAGDPRRLPGYAEGRFWIQEEGAQLVALAVGARPGERIADVCAGHGGKTLMLTARLSGRGQITSVDIDESKLDRVPAELSRLGLQDGVTAVQEPIDVSVGLADLGGDFDRVLVDAPCTGLGTLHRRPELMLRLRPVDLERLAELQRQILLRASELVRPGGTLTYAVCSPSHAEGRGVAEAFESAGADFTRIDPAGELPGIAADRDGILRIGPWLRHGPSVPDGYQVVAWRRTGPAPA